MKDINSVRVSGSIFWSKVDEYSNYSVLRLGIKLGDGSSTFTTINNPKIKDYESTKPGNKVILTNGWFDTWEKDDGSNDLQVKAYDSGIALFAPEKVITPINEVTLLGKVLSQEDDSLTLELVGERNPKTNKWTIRKARVNINEDIGNVIGKKLLIYGKIASKTSEDKKSMLTIESLVGGINIL